MHTLFMHLSACLLLPALIGASLPQAQPPKAPLTPQGLRNLQAFARAYGYLRWFHPTDAATAVDWDHLAALGAQRVEPADTPQALAGLLRDTFAGVAPGARFLLQGEPVPSATLLPAAQQSVAWSHEGVGLGSPGMYRSTRIYGPLPAIADPLVVKDLGGGIRLAFATRVQVDGEKRTLPQAEPARASASPSDRSRRLGAALQAWAVLQHFYPDFADTAVDWQAQLPQALAAVATCTTDEEAALALQAMYLPLKDGHANAVPERTSRPRRARPGVELVWVGEDLAVATVVPEWADRIHPGDRVVAMDGEPIAAHLARQAPVASGTPQGARVTQALRALMGPEGPLTLDLVNPEGRPRRVVAERRGVALGPSERRPNPCAELEPSVWYVDLTRLSIAETPACLERIAAARALVVDVRGYPTHMGVWRHLFARLAAGRLWTCPLSSCPRWSGPTGRA